MPTKGRLAILGAALILSAATIGAYKGYTDHERGDFAWLPESDGRASFALYVSEPAWKLITEHKGRGWTDQLLNAKVHAQINGLVEEGMRGERQGCPHRWLLGAVWPLRDGSILFRGFCASDDELQEGGGDPFSHVSTQS
jgi:hypothetical protein